MPGLTTYLRATYPSIGVSATPPAAFSVDATSLGSVGLSPGFLVIPVLGQSNNSCMSTGGTQAPAASNVFQFGKNNTLNTLQQDYDTAPGGLLDLISAGSTGTGGNATSLANRYALITGKQIVIVPCASLGSGYFNVAVSGQTNWWDPSDPHGNKLRNSLYGSALARCLNLLALGGVYAWTWHYQGEAEASAGGSFLTNHPSKVDNMLTQFHADLGVTERSVLQPIANTLFGATGPNIATSQAGIASLSAAGKRLIGTPWNGTMEADNVHVSATGCDTIGLAAANLALAAGW